MKFLKSLMILGLFSVNTVSLFAMERLGDKLMPLYKNTNEAQKQLDILLEKNKDASFYQSAYQASKSLSEALKPITLHYKRYDAAHNPNSEYKGIMFIQTSHPIANVQANLEKAKNDIDRAIKNNEAHGFFAKTKRFISNIFTKDSQNRLFEIKDLLDKSLSLLTSPSNPHI